MLHALFWWPHLTADPSWAERHSECLNLFLRALTVKLCVSHLILCCRSWFLTQVAESYFYSYLWSFAREGGACMQVCVGVFTHAFCYTIAKSQVPTQQSRGSYFLVSLILTHLFHLPFSKRNRNQILWQWPLKSRVIILPNRWVSFKVSDWLMFPKQAVSVGVSDNIEEKRGGLWVSSVAPWLELSRWKLK